MNDLVSIIVPVYNASYTIERCINSLKAQTYTNFQVILVNDGSKDDSLNVCFELTRADSRFIIIDKENEGVSSARNCGIKHALGKYLLFLDSDDWLETDMIECYMNMIHDHSADIVIGSMHGILAENGDGFIKQVPKIGLQKKEIWETICCAPEMFGYIGGKLFRRDVIETFFIRFNEEMYAQEDLDFCLSYYDKVDTFFLTDYAGYQYFYQSGKRIPPYNDFIRNQLKLFSIAKQKYSMSLEADRRIQERICNYIYVLFYEGKSKIDIKDAFVKMQEIEGLETFLRNCALQGENKFIISWYLKGRYSRIYSYFKVRQLIKKIVVKK